MNHAFINTFERGRKKKLEMFQMLSTILVNNGFHETNSSFLIEKIGDT